MSPRAASRLVRLGFGKVYDYVLGKTGWLADGLPYEGEPPGAPFAGEHLREVASCRLEERLDAVRERASDGLCVVLGADGVVQGRLRMDRVKGNGGRTAEEAMERGPTTVRASEPVEEIAHRMAHAGARQVLVTDAAGRLLGLLDRADAERVLAGNGQRARVARPS
jgi:hypothetical protein